jgi:hypothetical protein
MLAIPSPTGFTDTIVRYVAERLEELGIPFEMTRRGTIRATLKGQKNSPTVPSPRTWTPSAPAVRAVQDNGRLTLAPVGCWSSRFAEGSRVSLFTDNGVIPRQRVAADGLRARLQHRRGRDADQLGSRRSAPGRLLHHPRRLRFAGHQHR